MLKPIENSIIPLSIVSPSKTIGKSKIQKNNGATNVNNIRTDAKIKIIKQIGTRQKSK
jgi:hypothetical protein